MKYLTHLLSAVAILFSVNSLTAQDSSVVQAKNKEQNRYMNQTKTAVQVQTKAKYGSKGFIDENGDGFNDNAMDHDGDGIPNGQDADYDGAKARKGKGARGFVDEDGDGINDNAFDSDGDGIPNGKDADFIRPQDGTGRQNKYGAGQGKGQMNNGSGLGTGSGTGTCDGTGPKGTNKQKGKK